MKKLLLFSLIIISLSNLDAQITSSCIPPAILQANYDSDVKHLALKRIYELNSPYKDTIDIPQNYQDTIWQGLAAIYNLTTVIQRDSVFDNYCIHHEVSYFVVNSIYVGVDPSYSWTSQWQSLNTITGITAMDNLLATYGFTVTAYSTMGGHYAILTTTQNINVIPLCDSLEAFGGVIYAEPNYLAGAGNEIVYDKNINGRFYDFTVGYGDCLAGCTGKHTFKFKVYDDCSVDYLGVTDLIDPTSSIPPPTNCQITNDLGQTKNLPDFKIYPNPTENLLKVKKNDLSYSSYSISNLQGKILLGGNLLENTNIDIQNLANGLYLISFYNPSIEMSVNYKFIKN